MSMSVETELRKRYDVLRLTMVRQRKRGKDVATDPNLLRVSSHIDCVRLLRSTQSIGHVMVEALLAISN